MSNIRSTFVASAARTSDGDSGLLDFSQQVTVCRGLVAVLNVTEASGALPTLDVYLQQELPDGSFQDYAAFLQTISATKRILTVVPEAGASEAAASDKQLVARTVQRGPLGAKWRCAWKISGTTPSFTFSVDVELFECES